MCETIMWYKTGLFDLIRFLLPSHQIIAFLLEIILIWFAQVTQHCLVFTAEIAHRLISKHLVSCHLESSISRRNAPCKNKSLVYGLLTNWIPYRGTSFNKTKSSSSKSGLGCPVSLYTEIRYSHRCCSIILSHGCFITLPLLILHTSIHAPKLGISIKSLSVSLKKQ